jgi:hypothetical protein
VSFFDPDNRFLKKEEFTQEEKTEIIDKIIDVVNDEKWLNRAIDKILLTHRNTKLFLIMMTGPFLIGFKFV